MREDLLKIVASSFIRKIFLETIVLRFIIEITIRSSSNSPYLITVFYFSLILYFFHRTHGNFSNKLSRIISFAKACEKQYKKNKLTARHDRLNLQKGAQNTFSSYRNRKSSPLTPALYTYYGLTIL